VTLGLATIAAVCIGCSGLAVAAAKTAPTIRTDRGCYFVGQKVKITGSRFAPSRMYDVAVDGIDFGQSTTSATGNFASSLIPGGLGVGQAQLVHHLDVSDGTSHAAATFTVTRSKPGARFLAAGGDVRTLRAPLEAWAFSTSGKRSSTYLHYVSPSGRGIRTVSLGRAAGQCGYVHTGRLRVFPFSPSAGTWTLQVDTSRRYGKRPRGPIARINVQIHKA
jgi:hypothetical protein